MKPRYEYFEHRMRDGYVGSNYFEGCVFSGYRKVRDTRLALFSAGLLVGLAIASLLWWLIS